MSTTLFNSNDLQFTDDDGILDIEKCILLLPKLLALLQLNLPSSSTANMVLVCTNMEDREIVEDREIEGESGSGENNNTSTSNNRNRLTDDELYLLCAVIISLYSAIGSDELDIDIFEIDNIFNYYYITLLKLIEVYNDNNKIFIALTDCVIPLLSIAKEENFVLILENLETVLLNIEDNYKNPDILLQWMNILNEILVTLKPSHLINIASQIGNIYTTLYSVIQVNKHSNDDTNHDIYYEILTSALQHMDVMLHTLQCASNPTLFIGGDNSEDEDGNQANISTSPTDHDLSFTASECINNLLLKLMSILPDFPIVLSAIDDIARVLIPSISSELLNIVIRSLLDYMKDAEVPFWPSVLTALASCAEAKEDGLSDFFFDVMQYFIKLSHWTPEMGSIGGWAQTLDSFCCFLRCVTPEIKADPRFNKNIIEICGIFELVAQSPKIDEELLSYSVEVVSAVLLLETPELVPAIDTPTVHDLLNKGEEFQPDLVSSIKHKIKAPAKFVTIDENGPSDE